MQELEDDYQSDEDDALNDSGVDDINLRMHHTEFERIKNKTGGEFVANYVSVGPNHSIATDSSKNIPFTWGDNSFGQLGLGNWKSIKRPGAVNNFIEMINSEEVGTIQL